MVNTQFDHRYKPHKDVYLTILLLSCDSNISFSFSTNTKMLSFSNRIRYVVFYMSCNSSFHNICLTSTSSHITLVGPNVHGHMQTVLFYSEHRATLMAIFSQVNSSSTFSAQKKNWNLFAAIPIDRFCFRCFYFSWAAIASKYGCKDWWYFFPSKAQVTVTFLFVSIANYCFDQSLRFIN